MKKVNLWKIFKRTVIVTLVLGFFLSTNVLTLVKAATNILIPPTINFVDEFDTTIEKVELEHLRQKNLKVYLMPNYTLEYVYYDRDIHYYDGEKYQEITSVMEEENNTHIVKNDNYQIVFPNTINENKSIVLEYENYELSYTFENINNSLITASSEGQYSKIVYSEVLDKVNLEYYVLNEQLKENIILKEYKEDFIISYTMNTNGLTLQEEDNKVYLKNEKNDNIFEILPLYMVDANNIKSNDVEMEIVEIDNSIYQITIIPSNEFLQEATYPLTIDPIVSVDVTTESLSENGISFRTKTHLYGNSSTEPFSNSLYVGTFSDEYYGIIEFTRGTTLDKDNAKIVFSNDGEGSGRYNIYRLDSSYNYDNLIGTSFPTNNETYIGYGLYKDSLTEIEYNDVFLTGQTKSILVFKPNGDGYARISDSNFTATPFLKITNVNVTNEINTSYYDIDNGEVGKGQVNLINGRLTYNISNYTFDHNNNPFNIEHVYNSEYLINIGYGLGWSINYLETLTNVNSEYDYSIRLNKASKEGITFYKDSKTGDYKSVKNSDTIIVEDDKYVLYTNGEMRVYEVLDIGDSNTAYLTYIKKDSEYVGDLRIKHKINNNYVVIDKIIDGAGNIASFNYNNVNGYLSEIMYNLKTYDNPLDISTAIDTSKIVKYQYNGSLLEYICKIDNRNSLKSSDKLKIKLEYESNHLTKIYKVYDDDPILYQIGKKITYNDSNMVEKIETFSPANNKTNLDASFIYGMNKTKVTSSDKSLIYWFDIYGNIIKEVDTLGNITTYKYNNTYDNQHNLIDQTYQPGYNYNYIVNPAFLNNDGWNMDKETGVGSIDKCQSTLTLGQYQIEINRTKDGILNYYQDVTLEPGRYVVSSNIKNDNSTGSAKVLVSGTDIEIITKSNNINNSNGEYQKYYVEFEVKEKTEVRISLESTSIGKAYFDYVCLNKNRETVVENLIENSSFENSTLYGNNPYWNGTYEVFEQEVNNELFGNNCLVVFSNDYAYQTINTGGFKGDRFDLSLFVDPFSYDIVDYSKTHLEIVIEFNNSDNTTSLFYINSRNYSEFDENFDTEFLYAEVYAPKTYTSVTIKMKPVAIEGLCDEVIFVDYLSLSKNTSDVTNLTNEINELPTTVTLDNKETINDLYNRYLNLSNTEQNLLTNKSTLLDKVEQLHVLEFTTKVNELPSSITIDNIKDIEEIELLYNSLTEEEIDLIETTVKNSYFEYVKQKNVCYVIDLIDKLPTTINKDNYEEVIEVENEYNNLTETEQNLITNKNTLQIKINTKNIIQVNVLIEQLPTNNIFNDNVSGTTKEEVASLIIETEELYNALSNNDKTKIENITILQNAIAYKNSYLESNLDFEEIKVITKLEDYGYDNQYKVTDVDEFGGETNYTYNEVTGEIQKVEDALGNITEYYYGAFDYLQELKQIIDETTSSNVSYTYDKLGRVKTISKNGTLYTFTYNILNEITKIERDEITILEITYLEENGIPTSNVDSYNYNGTIISYEYDENNQIIEVKYNNVTKYTSKYDLLGNVVENHNIDDNYKQYYIYSYDGTLQELVDTNGNSIIYKENGKVIKTFDKEYEINYNYDEEEKLISENHNNLQISYSEQQNEDGEILSETIIYSIDSEQILRKDIHYNKSRISRIDYVYNDKTISINYSYDLNGNIEFTLTNTYNEEDELIHTKTEEYVYDSLNQLSNHKVYENNNQTLNVTYTYDLYGNIQTITRDTHLNEYASLPGYEEYTYDEEYKDLLISKIEKESASGNTINTYTYIYDSTKTNLLEVKKNDEIIETYTYLHRNLITYTNESTRIEYKYNSEGIRYQKDIYDKVTNQLLESRKYFLDGYKIISEEVTNTTESYTIYYKYDTNEEVIGYTYEEENDIKEYTYIKNYQGDVIGIIDETKQVVTEYVYDAYGQVISGDVSINSLLYRSYYYDQETSYYYLNSRYYNPEIARFQIADEITYLGITGSVNSYNLFGYCENNSVNGIDSLGNVYISMRTLGAVLLALAINPIASVLITIGIIKFKKMLLRLYTKLFAKLIASIPSTAAKIISFIIGLLGLKLIEPIASAIFECIMEGKKGIEIYFKRSKWGWFYKLTVEAK